MEAVTPYIIGKRYRLIEKIGEGSFGVVYGGVHVKTGDEVAVKIEGNAESPILRAEIACYRRLQGVQGIPRMRWSGWCNDGRVLVMDRLGDDLEKCFNRCGRRFTLATVLQIADQALRLLERVHSCSLLHRDIKPENFLLGLSDTALHLVDFGLAKQYRDEATHCHIMYREGKRLTGTPRYASVNAHLGIEQSRRDDLEALGYMLVYFLKGGLPWQGLRAATRKEKYARIAERKLATAAASLCAGLPSEFVRYFDHCRGLRFADKPDYRYLRALFWQVARVEGITYNGVYDWTTPKVDEVDEVDEDKKDAEAPTPPASEPPPP